LSARVLASLLARNLPLIIMCSENRRPPRRKRGADRFAAMRRAAANGMFG